MSSVTEKIFKLAFQSKIKQLGIVYYIMELSLNISCKASGYTKNNMHFTLPVRCGVPVLDKKNRLLWKRRLH